MKKQDQTQKPHTQWKQQLIMNPQQQNQRPRTDQPRLVVVGRGGGLKYSLQSKTGHPKI